MKITISGDTNKLRVADEDSVIYVPARSGTVTIQAGDETLKVVAIYSPSAANNGCWTVGVQPLHDGSPIPSWPVSINNGTCRFSPELTVEAPDNARVEVVNESGDTTIF